MGAKRDISLVWIAAVIFLIAAIFFAPNQAVEASKGGLQLWLNTVLPSLFPFIVLSNLLVGLGAVSLLGGLLEPFMRPLFRVPGEGAFAFLMGLISGYPVGAKITADMRHEKSISAEEAQRLVSFCNNGGPLFMLGAVGIGMFQSREIGFFIMLANYVGCLATGLVFRFYKRGGRSEGKAVRTTRAIVSHALLQQKNAYRKKGVGFGGLLAESIRNAMDVSLQIGGFIILFSVLIRVLTLVGFFMPLQNSPLALGIGAGIIEMTNGANLLAQVHDTKTAVLGTAAILAWGGLSIHAQTISLLAKTDIKPGLYLLAKLLHSLFTLLVAMLLLPLFESKLLPFFESKLVSYTPVSQGFSTGTGKISIFILLLGLAAFVWQDKKLFFGRRA